MMKSLSVSEMMFPWKPCHQRRAAIVLTHWSQGSRYGCLLSRQAYPSGSLDLGSDILLLERGLRLVVSVNCRASYFISVTPSCFKQLVGVPRSVLLFKSFLCTIYIYFFSVKGTSHDHIRLLWHLGAAACGQAVFGALPHSWRGRADPPAIA